MTRKRRLRDLGLAALVAAATAACAARGDVELPQDGDGDDAMRKSPCACEPVPFDGRGFRWLG